MAGQRWSVFYKSPSAERRHERGAPDSRPKRLPNTRPGARSPYQAFGNGSSISRVLSQQPCRLPARSIQLTKKQRETCRFNCLRQHPPYHFHILYKGDRDSFHTVSRLPPVFVWFFLPSIFIKFSAFPIASSAYRPCWLHVTNLPTLLRFSHTSLRRFHVYRSKARLHPSSSFHASLTFVSHNFEKTWMAWRGNDAAFCVGCPAGSGTGLLH